MVRDTPEEVIFLDVETGGLDSGTDALLTIGLVKWTGGTIKDRLEIFVDPEDKNIKESAIKINKINVSNHIKISNKRSEVIRQFEQFVWNGNDKILVGGHNTIFDYGFLISYGIELRRYFHHGVIDTKSIARMLVHADMIQPESTSLEHLCIYFNIPHNSHNALGDAISSAMLYNKLLELVMKRG